MRLNLDKVTHPIHCYYPASGKKYFDRLRFGTAFYQTIEVIEHPVEEDGLVEDDGRFRIEAKFLKHSVDNIGWRITEADMRKFDAEKLKNSGVRGPMVQQLQKEGSIVVDGKTVSLDDVSWIRHGDSIAVVLDTLPCSAVTDLARDARLFLCESTYLDTEKDLAKKHYHLTAKQAATMARDANAKMLVLTHFSARYQNLDAFAKEAGEIFTETFIGDDLKSFDLPR